jgi:excinuclease ABC subunit C
MQLPKLAQLIAGAPSGPGVYTWRDAHRHPLYVGKATNLKSRLSSYQKTLDPRIQAMIAEATSVRWQETGTDIEALILESRLIKRWHPKYNIVMRDDKQYFYVAITEGEFPQLVITHQARSNKIKKPVRELIGPFTDGVPLKSTLRTLRGLFPYCSCKNTHYVRCLNAHIGVCPGYCCLRKPATGEQKRAYARNIRAIHDILTGKRDTLIRVLEREMTSAADVHDLERALELRKRIERIKRVFENAQINARHQRVATQHHGALEQLAAELGLARIPRRIEGYDIAHMQGEHATGAMSVFTDGRADTSEYRMFNIKTVIGSNDTAMLREIISRRLTHADWPAPDLVLVDGSKAQLNVAMKTLTAAGLSTPVVALTKNDKHQGDHILSSLDGNVRTLKDMPRQLADLLVHIDTEAHRWAIRQYRRLHGRSMTQ